MFSLSIDLSPLIPDRQGIKRGSFWKFDRICQKQTRYDDPVNDVLQFHRHKLQNGLSYSRTTRVQVQILKKPDLEYQIQFSQEVHLR